LENSEKDKSVPTGVNPKIFMKLEILERRRKMLTMHYGGNVTTISLRMLAQQLTEKNQRNGIKKVITYAALRRDYNRRKTWESLVWQTFENGVEANDTLKFLKLARMKAITLMDSSDNDNAKVGAVGRLINVVEKEIELRQSLGQLPRVNMEPVINNNVNIDQQYYIKETGALLRNYEFLFKGGAQESDSGMDSSEECVDEASASGDSRRKEPTSRVSAPG
jgi:hypothetical protein